jgi:radical SAM superfamily enzyme YgiQ (UPF0313 family)
MQEATRREIKRLTDGEKGAIATAYGNLRVALVYPNSYRLGMSNLGFQTVYGLINRNPLARCERSFLLDAEEAVALESGLTLSSFDVVAFSISFELDYPNIVEVLRRARIPPRSEDRKESHPLILAGGAAMMLNPEPVADFMDAVVIGEAEPVLDGILSTVAAERRKGKLALFEKLAQLEGVYVPCLYQAESDEQGRLQGIKSLGSAPFPARRNSPPDIETFDTTTEILTPHTVFGKTFLVEVSRGCPRKCKFCAGTQVYCPPRYRSAGRVIASVEQLAPNQRRVGLLGAAVGDHPQIEHICSTLVEQGRSVSISSVRPGKVSPELARLLFRGGAKTLTVAPEAGSEELRRKVGKPLSNEELTDCARIVKEAGIQSLKVYVMVGLPGEERQDVDEIVARVAELASIIRVKVSVSPFVPKARTPYQRIGTRSLDYLRNTISDLHKATRKIPGVTFSAGSPRHSLIEAALSRGNRSASRWLETGTISAREQEHLACRTIPEDETLPWDHLQDATRG